MLCFGNRPTIVIHQFGRGPRAPSLSPFVVKLETYMRMAKLEYTSEFGMKMSSKGKIPWMTCNGKVVADSQLCIDFLNKEMGIDLSAHLTPEERAIARAFQKMVEENSYWVMALTRFVFDNKEFLGKVVGLPKIFIWIAGIKIKTMSCGQGIGRHSYKELIDILEGDLRALSVFLGDKRFLFGDRPCEADAAIFGQLSQFRWHNPGAPGEKFVTETFSNLRDYCERMKTMFWPDWDECITHDRTTKPSK
ncbi:failed axon connections homolog [Gigantopelta aegis]|uniref:failed axon connections homolog n=1 Tax=Gigantopelta aegis TaxID=1735272 RepID=UPI001B889089|nr:failed axon connections homolog [Gigantopelta aegis]